MAQPTIIFFPMQQAQFLAFFMSKQVIFHNNYLNDGSRYVWLIVVF